MKTNQKTFKLTGLKAGVNLIIFFSVLMFYVSGNAQNNWLHFGFDNQYTAYNPNETLITVENISQLERIWGIGCDDGSFSVISRSPAIFKGKLYTSSAGGKLTAYNAETGDFLWEFGEGNYGWAPQPVVSEDSIVFYMEKSIPTYLYAVDAINGNQIWEAPIGFQVGFSDEILVTVDEDNDVVYVLEYSGYEGKLFAINKQDGEVDWYLSKAITDTLDFRGQHVLLKDNVIYSRAEVGEDYSAREYIIRINASTQEFEFKYNRPEPEDYYDIKQYTICNDKLIIGYDYQYEPVKILAAYNLSSSDTIWQKQFSEITGTIACNTTKNIIYVPTDPYLYALDLETGEEIWKYTGYSSIYNPSVANNIVYFISDNNLYALNEDTGEKIFQYDLGYAGYETTQAAICNGMLYFSGNGGTCDLFALGFGSTGLNNDNKYTHVLNQNYPNPFCTSTTICYQLAVAGNVELTVYNTLGQKVKTLVNQLQKAGEYTVNFYTGGLNDGIYFYKLTTNRISKIRKMQIIK